MCQSEKEGPCVDKASVAQDKFYCSLLGSCFAAEFSSSAKMYKL